MSQKYDDVPKELWGNPKRIWQLQISGEKNFDDYSFMGCLNGFQNDPDWRSVFDPIKNVFGMQAFLNKLEGHFELCKSPEALNGGQYLYMHPNRTKPIAKIDRKDLTNLANRYIKATAEAYRLSGHLGAAKKMRKYKAEYLSDGSDYPLDPIDLYLSAAWDFESYSKSAPEIVGCLYEASYSLANDFALTRYLMNSFYDHNLDVEAEYELIWKHNAKVHFDENKCFVTSPQKKKFEEMGSHTHMRSRGPD